MLSTRVNTPYITRETDRRERNLEERDGFSVYGNILKRKRKIDINKKVEELAPMEIIARQKSKLYENLFAKMEENRYIIARS